MSNLISFTKMHGLANDFVVIDSTKVNFTLSSSQIAQLGNRHTGIGFDQMLVILPSQEAGIDFYYQIYNQDGSEVGNCGNGVRCFTRYVFEKGLTNKRKLLVKTKTAQMSIELGLDNLVKVEMGHPNFLLSSLPCLLAQKTKGWYSLPEVNYNLGLVSMGNPHAVMVVDDLASFDILPIGAFLQNHEMFPMSVNVGFMQIISRNEINLRVYERGVGETYACGTGACAAVAIGIFEGILNSDVTVNLKGGQLDIVWDKHRPLIMTGSADFVFDGQIDLDYFTF